MPHLVATALASAAMAVLPAASALADQTPARDDRVRSELRLTLTYPAPSTSGARIVTLQCEPHGGSHPNAEQACDELLSQDGNPAHDPGDTACTTIYSPVVAEAKGTWRGRRVNFRKKYANDCVLRSRTGSVFAF